MGCITRISEPLRPQPHSLEGHRSRFQDIPTTSLAPAHGWKCRRPKPISVCDLPVSSVCEEQAEKVPTWDGCRYGVPICSWRDRGCLHPTLLLLWSEKQRDHNLNFGHRNWMSELASHFSLVLEDREDRMTTCSSGCDGESATASPGP